MKNSIFEKNFNLIIAADYTSASNNFLNDYLSNPEMIELVHGYTFSMILNKDLNELLKFLKKEKEISRLSSKIKLLFNYITNNLNIFQTSKPESIIFNIGLFLKNKNLEEESSLYFKMCNLLDSSNTKTQTALGEMALKNKEFKKGIRLFSNSAKSECSKIKG